MHQKLNNKNNNNNNNKSWCKHNQAWRALRDEVLCVVIVTQHFYYVSLIPRFSRVSMGMKVHSQ